MAHLHRYSSLLGALALSSLLLGGCTDDPVFPAKSVSVRAPAMPRLMGDAYYEVWFSYPTSASNGKNPGVDHGDAAFFSIGKFRVGDDGSLVNLSGGPATFAIPEGYNPNLIIDGIVTVEPAGNDDKLPGARILAGAFEGTQQQAFTRMEPADAEAFGNKILNQESGLALLDAPTSDLAGDKTRGVWFVLFSNNGTRIDTLPGLGLAPMPLNAENGEWSYQSWLVRNAGTAGEEYIKLGRFLGVNRADSTGAGAGAGSMPSRIHAAPGEDFVGAAGRSLNDGTYGLIVSAEPIGIELQRPLLQLLKADRIASGTAAGTPIQLTRPSNPPYMEVTVDR